MDRSIGIHYQPVAKQVIKSASPLVTYHVSLEEGILDGHLARFRIVNLRRIQRAESKEAMDIERDVVLPAEPETLDAIIAALQELRSKLDAPLPPKKDVK